MVRGKSNINQNIKAVGALRLILVMVLVLLINFMATLVFTRFDFTAEKRYSLSQASIDLMEGLEDAVYIKFYLSGDLPAEYQRLQVEVLEMLNEFRAYSSGNLSYELIDPYQNVSQAQENDINRSLYEQGLFPTNIAVKQKGGKNEIMIWPGAIVTYAGKETPVQLLKSQIGSEEEVIINNSIQQIEYNIASAIQKIRKQSPPQIGIIQGHGELDPKYLQDFKNAAQELFEVSFVEISGDLNALKPYDAIVVAKPDSLFGKADKFIIDQFIMGGGGVLWLLDMVQASMDSLQSSAMTMALAANSDLGEMLFSYGVRLNNELVMDIRSVPIPVITGYIGNKPRQEFFPWFYFPLVLPQANTHPIVHNIEGLKTEFIGSIDTVKADGIKKTILLSSSQYGRVKSVPARVSVSELRGAPDYKLYSKKNIPLSVLLEGSFESAFANRVVPISAQGESIGIVKKGKPARQIVVADGDVIKNKYDATKDVFYPLEYDRYTDKIYGNKDFLMNALTYLSDKNGLILSRSKEFKIRMLDKQFIEKTTSVWKLFNLVLPLFLLFVFAVLNKAVRRLRYSKK